MKHYVQMGLYDIKSTRVEIKLTLEHLCIGETPGALNGQETKDKVKSDNSLMVCHIKNAFLHLCFLFVPDFVNPSVNISGMKLKKFLNLSEVVGIFHPILFQVSYHSYERLNNCQTP